jgi:23S rRNA (uracil1939-C5)-methyltransferase
MWLGSHLQLTIEKLVYGGDGLARLPADDHGRGKAAFAPFVLGGETIEAVLLEEKRGFVRARAETILQPSPQRVEPQCPYFQSCGGCHYQHARYEHQLEIKASILKENLRRIAKLELKTELIVHPSPPWNYRNRARLQVRNSPDFALGYYRFNSHELLAVEQCPISSPLINRAISRLWEAGRVGGLPAEISEIEFFSDADDTTLLAECYCAPETSSQQAQEIAGQLKLALPDTVGIAMFHTLRPGAAQTEAKPLALPGAGELTYRTQSASYRVSAGAFFQVNRHLIDTLVKLVTEGRSGRKALDLYAGVGLFSTVLARSFAQVIAVEASPTSFADLKYNSPRNVKAVRAMTDQYLRQEAGRWKPDLVVPDLIVIDPPRSGLGESVVSGLAPLGAPQMVYVSCDPATLARDLKGFLSSGYRVEQAHLVDLFPQTYHVESVFHLLR